MSASRSAMMVLAGCLFLSPPTYYGRSAESPARHTEARAAYPPDASIGWVLSRPPRSATLSHFSPWRARPKIVFEETNHNLVEEFDLGPAQVPSRLISAPPTLLAAPRLRAASPLRC